MLRGFERETAPLTDHEREVLLPLFVKGLSGKFGERHAVTNTQMRKGLRKAGYKVGDPRVRKIINHIRINGLVTCLIATSKGYYIAETEAEAVAYLESLDQRIEAQRAVWKATKRQKDNKFAAKQAEMTFN